MAFSERTQVATAADGSAVFAYRLVTPRFDVRLLSYGATISHFLVKTKRGESYDIVLGFDTYEEYLKAAQTDNCYIGCTTGRFAGRIKDGRFTLDGVVYELPKNNNGNFLHGGFEGFDKRNWASDWSPNHTTERPAVQFTLVSPDGDQGFPGTLTAVVTFTVTDTGVVIEQRANTTKPTYVNLTNHSYFNLSGMQSDVLSTVLQIHADKYAPTDDNACICDDLQDVPPHLDFHQARSIGPPDVDRSTFQGYDISYHVAGWQKDGQLRHLARATEKQTGLGLDVFGTGVDVHLYTSYYLTGNLATKEAHRKYAATYPQFGGFCLEVQQFPDAPNRPSFPSTLLRPDETYLETIVFNPFETD